MSTPNAPLSGERVLIVEDKYLIASEMAREVEELGGRVVGPSRSVADAKAALAEEGVDLALLDVTLDAEDVFPLASELEAAGVPFVFTTGYDGEVLPARWRERPRIAKPVNWRLLRDELTRLAGNKSPSRVSS